MPFGLRAAADLFTVTRETTAMRDFDPANVAPRWPTTTRLGFLAAISLKNGGGQCTKLTFFAHAPRPV
jgi:hypothetical protein